MGKSRNDDVYGEMEDALGRTVSMRLIGVDEVNDGRLISPHPPLFEIFATSHQTNSPTGGPTSDIIGKLASFVTSWSQSGPTN